MTTAMSPLEHNLQQGFKYFNKFMLLLWRLGLGPWVNYSPQVGGRIMVIAHTGRKSQKTYHTPVNYALVDGDLYCTAGFGKLSDWYRNLLANPLVEIWLPDGWWEGVAEDISDSEHYLTLLRQVLVNSGFAAFAAGINPYEITDAELAKAATGYRLIRIRRMAARTGPGGPGDLWWVWPTATFLLLLPLALRRRK